MEEEIKQEIKKTDDGFKPIPTGETPQPAPRGFGNRQGGGQRQGGGGFGVRRNEETVERYGFGESGRFGAKG